MPLALELAPLHGSRLVAASMGLSHATLCRLLAPEREKPPRPKPVWALTEADEQAILDVLHTEEFVDMAPAEVVAVLLDRGLYLGSTRTFYRVLNKHQEVKERRNQLIHPKHEVPRLVAKAPNQVWSWDITKLKGPGAWEFFYLYVILDIFSRYVVGWMLALSENAEFAKRLFEQAYEDQGIMKGQVTAHSDRGPQMTAVPMFVLMGKLGIVQSFSRPRVSNDNPFSESQFRTLKYRPDYPGRFGGYEDAEAWCRRFFAWHNHEHRHGGIAYLTPAMVHQNRAQEAIARRQAALDDAYRRRPERFSKRPLHPALPEEVWINNPSKTGLVQAA
jgi:putative transposase